MRRSSGESWIDAKDLDNHDKRTPLSNSQAVSDLLWQSFKKIQRAKKGLHEIGPDHPKFLFTVCLRRCFSTCLLHVPANGQIKSTDYDEVISKSIRLADWPHMMRPATASKARHADPASSQASPTASVVSDTVLSRRKSIRIELMRMPDVEVAFKVFAPKVFSCMREAFGLTHEEFLSSLSPEEDFLPYLKFVANSKSNSSFFFTYDRRFILKIERSSDISRFLRLLENYIDHFISSPHSLIVKIFGVFSIKIGKGKEAFLIVMQSIFWPSSQIREKYDLKGCLKGRYENPNTVTSFADFDSIVYKDQNFVRKNHLDLGNSQSWFLRQLSRDVEFLRRQGIVDYSLLVGIQHLSKRSNPKRSQSLAEIVSSIKRSSLGFASNDFKKNQNNDKKSQASDSGIEDRYSRVNSNEGLDDKLTSSLSNAQAYLDQLATLDLQDDEMTIVDDILISEENGMKATREKSLARSFQTYQIKNEPFGQDGTKSSHHFKKPKTSGDPISALPPLSRYANPSPSSSSVHFQVHHNPEGSRQTSVEDNAGTEEETEKGEIEKSKDKATSRKKGLRVFLNIPNATDNRVHPSNTTKSSSESLQPLSPLINDFEDEKKSKLRRSRVSVSYDKIEKAPSANGAIDTLYNWHRFPEMRGPENRRLLPDSPNGVHIIDGPQSRYYFGIVDIFAKYNARRKVAGLVKTLIHCGTDHSTTDPDTYAQRFKHFIEDHL